MISFKRKPVLAVDLVKDQVKQGRIDDGDGINHEDTHPDDFEPGNEWDHYKQDKEFDAYKEFMAYDLFEYGKSIVHSPPLDRSAAKQLQLEKSQSQTGQIGEGRYPCQSIAY